MTASVDSFFQQLNSQQAEAVRQTEGPVLVLAGAGSGKTRAITYKVAYLIDQERCRPEEILAVTFTNKAAEEMRERVSHLVGELERPPLISTFHSFGVRILRPHAPLLGWGHDFVICDADDQLSVYREVYRRLELNESGAMPIRLARALVSRAKNRGWGPDQHLAHSKDADTPLVASIFRAYEKQLKESNSMDFDDLILHSVRLLREHSEVRKRVAGRFRYLLIDEYQDTNQPQYELTRLLTETHQNLTVVGDEDQSIYGFRGADIGNILRFHEDFPNACIIKLERNYRSTQVILDAATALVSNNSQRREKILWTEDARGELIDLFVANHAGEEAVVVARTVRDCLAAEASKIAVLYRTNFQSRVFEQAFRQLDIPYILVGGVSFFSRKEIKDILAFLRCLQNPRDAVSLLRILNEPPRGIGSKTVERLQALADERGLSLIETIALVVEEHLLPGRAQGALASFHSILDGCRAALEERPLHLAIDRILKVTGYVGHLDGQPGPEAADRKENLGELVNMAREFAEAGLGVQEFLDSCALYADTDEYDGSARVHLMTLHNAKGLEFEAVFLAGLEEGLLPHSRSQEPHELEEERRLCYVGLTRARRRLFLSYSRTRRMRGRETRELNRPSRFLREIPPQLIRSGPQSVEAFAVRVPQLERARQRPFDGTTYDTPESVNRFLQQLPGSKKPGGGSIRPGSLVEHQKFGRGKVLQIEQQGDDLKITVHFSGIGIKKLLQSYARLRPI